MIYRILLPLIWLSAAWVSWLHPGDEYGLFIASILPFIGLVKLLEFTHLSEIVLVLLVFGTTTMALVGWGLDHLKVRLWIALPILLIGAVWITWYGLSGYERYERAMGKNGSLWAYVSAATNLSLYLTVLVTAFGALMIRGVGWVRGDCNTVG